MTDLSSPKHSPTDLLTELLRELRRTNPSEAVSHAEELAEAIAGGAPFPVVDDAIRDYQTTGLEERVRQETILEAQGDTSES